MDDALTTDAAARRRVVLVHGAASGPWVFDGWAGAFPDDDVRVPDLQEGLDVARASMSDYADRVLAAAGAGIYPSVAEAAKGMVTVERTIEPDPVRHEEYRFFVDRYIETYPKLRDVIHQTVEHVAGAGVPAAPSDEGAYDLATEAKVQV